MVFFLHWQLVDEACSSVRVQLDSQPEVIDKLERKQMTLEVEATALAGEKQDAATKTRLAEVRDQLAALREELHPLRARFDAEKSRVDEVRGQWGSGAVGQLVFAWGVCSGVLVCACVLCMGAVGWYT